MEKLFDFEILKQVIYNYFNAIANKLEYNDYIQKNIVLICGIIKSLPQFSHTVIGESFYNLMVAIPRHSGAEDLLPVTISERMLDLNSLSIGQTISLTGQFRSYNQVNESGKLRLILTVFAKDAAIIEPGESIRYENEILLDGYICKAPTYRPTPSGREISDVMLAVNRSYNKTDYIPIILWGRNARYSAGSQIGERMVVVGRIQSRSYEKALESGETVKRTAYEVSVSSMAITGQNNCKLEEQDSPGSAA